jgi:hypothetical protein
MSNWEIGSGEQTHARQNLIMPLNNAVQRAATAAGWNIISGVADLAYFTGPLCSAQRFYNDFDDSNRKQGDELGTMHPNSKGHSKIADQLLRAIHIENSVRQHNSDFASPSVRPGKRYSFSPLTAVQRSYALSDAPTGTAVTEPSSWLSAGIDHPADRLRLGIDTSECARFAELQLRSPEPRVIHNGSHLSTVTFPLPWEGYCVEILGRDGSGQLTQISQACGSPVAVRVPISRADLVALVANPINHMIDPTPGVPLKGVSSYDGAYGTIDVQAVCLD